MAVLIAFRLHLSRKLSDAQSVTPAFIGEVAYSILAFFQEGLTGSILPDYLKFVGLAGIDFNCRTHRRGESDAFDILAFCA
jgi:hypothetical protein